MKKWKRSPLLVHKELIRVLRSEGGTAPYRREYLRVKGTEAEAFFWCTLQWRAHAFELRQLLDHQNQLLLRAARERDLLLTRLV